MHGAGRQLNIYGGSWIGGRCRRGQVSHARVSVAVYVRGRGYLTGCEVRQVEEARNRLVASHERRAAKVKAELAAQEELQRSGVGRVDEE